MIKKIVFILLFLLVLPLVLANPEGYYKLNEPINIQSRCFDSNSLTQSVTTANITVISPDGIVLVDNQAMVDQGSYHNYTLTDTDQYGKHTIIRKCIVNGQYAETGSYILINNAGHEENPLIVLSAILIILASIALYGWSAFKVNEYHKDLKLILFGSSFFNLTGALVVGFNAVAGWISLEPILIVLASINIVIIVIMLWYFVINRKLSKIGDWFE
jgi:hypothetical protein